MNDYGILQLLTPMFARGQYKDTTAFAIRMYMTHNRYMIFKSIEGFYE